MDRIEFAVAKFLEGCLFGGMIATGTFLTLWPYQPKYTETPKGWTLEHIAMPECPNDHKRTVDIPERDEVDALTISCLK